MKKIGLVVDALVMKMAVTAAFLEGNPNAVKGFLLGFAVGFITKAILS